ncbi:MAG: hypothetical protein KAJ19_20215, partial [Gammaproteobacteria bacterium]|nr:hypothetical protein [Gammaproteobacteria bacterium]
GVTRRRPMPFYVLSRRRPCTGEHEKDMTNYEIQKHRDRSIIQDPIGVVFSRCGLRNAIGQGHTLVDGGTAHCRVRRTARGS